MKNPDTRIQMTKRLLKDAMLEILKEKPISSVTVKELCDTAGINRGTFYLHYDTPLSLLKEIENEFVQNNMAMFESFMKADYDSSYLSHLFESVWQNRDLLCILLGANGDSGFLKSLQELVRRRTVTEWNTEFPKYQRDHLDFLFDYVFPGFTSLMLNWFENNYGIDSTEFTHRIERLGHYALLAAKEFN